MSHKFYSPAPTYGEGYDAGFKDGGFKARAEICTAIADRIDARATTAEQDVYDAQTLSARRVASSVAVWLRDLAAEVRAGAL